MAKIKSDDENYKFIIRFNKISFTKICRKLNINRSSASSGTTSKENYAKIRKEIEHEFALLYLKEEDFNNGS